MVGRYLKLETIVTEERADEHVQAYFEEAMHCYVHGFSAAAVSLSRACLEQALRDTSVLPATGLDLSGLIQAASLTRQLDGAYLHMARQIQRIGNATRRF